MKVTFWQMIPIALGLHGLMLITPIPAPQATIEKPEPKSSPVAITQLPKSTPPKAAPAKPQPRPEITPKPKLQAVKPILQRDLSSIAPIFPTPQPSPQPPETTPKTPEAKPTPTPTPSALPSPTPTPSDTLQIDGAQPGCNGREGCWQIAQTQGRMIAGTLEKQLQDKGYTLTQQELNDDTGMSVYEVAKDGARQYYLHVIWSDRGTVYVRNPQLMSRSELEAATLRGFTE